MMVSPLLYAYCAGERSSRRIEGLCARDVGFKAVCANLIPDHSTIARFRKENEKSSEDLFSEALKLCAQGGLIKRGVVAQAEKEQEIRDREAKEKKAGKKKRGRKPKNPDKVKEEKEKKAKMNLTDPESRIMKTRKGYVQGYNAQAVVTEDQISIAAELPQEENDLNQLHPMLGKARESLEAISCERPVEAACADAGYMSERNVEDAK